MHPVTVVQSPLASHETDDGLASPSYPSAHATDEVPPYVVVVVPVNVYPVSDGLSQSDI